MSSSESLAEMASSIGAFLAAPAVLLGAVALGAVRAMFRPAPRSNAQVLAFIAPTNGLTACAVCEEPVRNRRVTCASCNTVQHRECYEFIGHCGASGCLCQRVR